MDKGEQEQRRNDDVNERIYKRGHLGCMRNNYKGKYKNFNFCR